jgi:hypothetical protein
VSVVAVLLDGEPQGSVLVIAAWLVTDLAVLVCLRVDLPAVVAGTGLAHQVGLIRSLSALGVTHHRYAAR